jgi:membrane protease YdiL (CAAX protease family)
MTLRIPRVLLGVAGGGAMVVVGFLLERSMRALGVWPDFRLWEILRSYYPGFFTVLAVVIAPIGEELYFRGRLLAAVQASLGLPAAVVISSLVFAAAHPVPALLPAFVLLGLILAALRVWSGGLVAPMVAHALNNAVAILALSD